MPIALRLLAITGLATPTLSFALFLPPGSQSPPAPDLDRSARAILNRACVSCHGEAKISGLDLRQLDTVLKGGQKGPAVIPGNAEASLLYQAASHKGALKMPPGSKAPLPATDLKVLRDWINSADVWRPPPSNSIFTEAQRSFWAFQPVQNTTPPEAKGNTWAKTPLDHFILAKLEQKGLSPAPAADKRTLIRRATFDLTGLPPTAEEIDEFLADDSPAAFAHLVDRLLKSPQYGERWGRQWLDVVRYADTSGIDNMIYRYGYRYRDYVVRAFKEDKPYDQFIIEQLAGDLLPATKDLNLAAERMIAPGFLMLGPKGTAEQDKEQLLLDIVDEQIDATSRAFLALTVSCARCHNHKFDPIPTRDYCSLAGIFRSTDTLADLQLTSMWWEYPVLQIPGGETLTVMAPREGKPADLRVHIRGNYHNLGEEAPRGFLRIISSSSRAKIDASQSGRLQLAQWIASPENPLTARVMVNRIWQGHFGRGLVATSDNFGALGDRPSHPELLNWLASQLVESGWSVKAMHRLIMLSNTYQMQSSPNERAKSVDPDNVFLWHANRRRLDAGELRDALLAISGELDRKMGGTIFDWEDRNELVDKDRGLFSASKAGTNFESYKTLRRSIYVPVVRNQLPEIFTAFDFADPNVVTSVRNDTTTAVQSLFLINSPFVRDRGFHFARQLLEGISQSPQFKSLYRLGLATPSDEHRLRLAHLQVLGRPPTPEELAQAMAFLDEYSKRLRAAGRSEAESRLAAWQSYCQSLFCLNEFLYVN